MLGDDKGSLWICASTNVTYTSFYLRENFSIRDLQKVGTKENIKQPHKISCEASQLCLENFTIVPLAQGSALG